MISLSKLLQIQHPVILASQSPRRKQLLQQLGLEFSVQPSGLDETAVPFKNDFGEFVTRLALLKAQDVAAKTQQRSIVIGADTIVVLKGEKLEKPLDAVDAARMLRALSDNVHTVFTGIALVDSESGVFKTACQETAVTFRELEEEEIVAYITTGSPLDKAGAYGIQDDFGAVFVREIAGDYYNIVGLPLELLYRKLKEFLKDAF
jgi:septum formation protein